MPLLPFARRRSSSLTPRQSLAARPIRLVDAQLTETKDGGARLVAPLQPRRAARWFFRIPANATKTFELDAIGVLVWNQCDGKTSVERIIHVLAKRYNLTLREAQVPTLQFLQTLARKGLIGMKVKK